MGLNDKKEEWLNYRKTVCKRAQDTTTGGLGNIGTTSDVDEGFIKNSDLSGNHPCLNILTQDPVYSEINLIQDFSGLVLNSNEYSESKQLDNLKILNKTIDTVSRLNQIAENEKLKQTADLEIKQRFTYSALSKLIVLALFVMFFIFVLITLG